MGFSVWKLRQMMVVEMCEYVTEELHVVYSIHAQGGDFRKGW